MSFITQGVRVVRGYKAEINAPDKKVKSQGQTPPASQDSESTEATATNPKPQAELPAYDTPIDRNAPLQPLPLPIIIPQRRPKSKHRGFLRAYAPDLARYKGIDQETFLAFLDKLNESSMGNHTFRVINGYAMGATLVPEGVILATAMGVMAITRSALEVQGRYSRNTFLDKANDEIFHPKKLHCMVVIFEPESADTPVLDENLEANPSDKTSPTSHNVSEKSLRKTKMGQFRTSDTVTSGELELPQAAELVYPPSDDDTDSAVEGKKERFANSKRRLRNLEDYKDRRARAKYIGTYGEDSKLATPGAADRSNFVSKYSDPNHPVHRQKPVPVWKGGSRSQAYTMDAEADSSDHQPAKSEPGRVATMRSKLQESILYLMITELPADVYTK